MNLVIYFSQDHRKKDSRVHLWIEISFVPCHSVLLFQDPYTNIRHIQYYVQSPDCLEYNLFSTLFRNVICSRYLRLIQRTLISYRDSQIDLKLNSEPLRKHSSQRSVIRIYREKSLMISQRDTSSLRVVTGQLLWTNYTKEVCECVSLKEIRADW